MKINDLVQQTRSADAAESLVGLTFTQSRMMLIGTIIGFFTLIAAVAAAAFAKLASDHTKSGAAEAKRQADAAERGLQDAQNQARATFVSEREEVSRPAVDEILLTMRLRNVGQTPAHAVLIQVEGEFVTNRSSATLLLSGPISMGTIARSGVIEIRESIRLTKRQVASIEKAGHCSLDYSILFADTYGDRWSYEHNLLINREAIEIGMAFTTRCYHIRHKREEEKPPTQELPLEGGRDGKEPAPD